MRIKKVKELIRVFVKGGIISPGDFLRILLVAEKLGAEHIHFGSRQDILLPITERDKDILDKTFESIGMEYEVNTFHYQNISSSYVAQHILPSKQWLASHVYQNILDGFNYRATLRVNIVDPSQSLVPLFTGQVNFIASNQENYWYVYLRFRSIQESPWQMPLFVYSEDLVDVAKAVEQLYSEHSSISFKQIFDYLTSEVQMNTQPVTEDLILPETPFPYYEGINRMDGDKYWLGLYWRNNEYSISTLKGMMERCINTDVGKVSLTPWKSFIIKGISEKNLTGWEKLMGRSGMNMRHSALELNWHLPALDQEALELKMYLVRELDQQDVSTYGLTFTIKTSDDITLFTSIVIEKNNEDADLDTYNLLYSKDFNANATEYSVYASDVPKTVITSLIVELCLLYFDNMNESTHTSPRVKLIQDSVSKELYQCGRCKTVYDSEYGDAAAAVPAGTSFQDIPADYQCPTCGSSKEVYAEISF
ncbi:MAG: rubredoxin domain-containing protein [Bacteroidota bacterium]